MRWWGIRGSNVHFFVDRPDPPPDHRVVLGDTEWVNEPWPEWGGWHNAIGHSCMVVWVISASVWALVIPCWVISVSRANCGLVCGWAWGRASHRVGCGWLGLGLSLLEWLKLFSKVLDGILDLCPLATNYIPLGLRHHNSIWLKPEWPSNRGA